MTGTLGHGGRMLAIGECMIELARRPDGLMAAGFGGDTLNTAVYLARLGVAVDYGTALGDGDPFSGGMLVAWAAEGVGTERVVRVPGRLPGLYAIETDDAGERRFFYWRDRAPIRDLFARSEGARLLDGLPGYAMVYLSGITLAVIGAAGRTALWPALDKARAAGTRIAFDSNFRPALWPDLDEAREAYSQALARTDLAFPGMADERAVFGDADADAVAARVTAAGVAEVVIKLDRPACRVLAAGRDEVVEAPPVAQVVDTTAAGDSFSAAYMAARLDGADLSVAARAGHRLAGVVIGHRGAIIPKAATPALPDLLRP
ncbi:MAG TPA: sugar kinase [Azospirillaceae bacterium]|nr:sugar kinase [Azospirillaceae bacterium]